MLARNGISGLLGAVSLALALTVAFGQPPVLAQQGPAAVLDVRYSVAPRAQIAIWIEDAEGRFMATVRLTEAVAYRGIGNRPGASEMNSGYRWPYGRRVGVLPIWAARRAGEQGAQSFKQVIFQERGEGAASKTRDDQSVDDYFCLSFNEMTTHRDALDAVSCASVFSSDKGRFMTPDDVVAGYWEPYVTPGGRADMAILPAESGYPPRMDLTRCTASGCYDHPDVAEFAEHARAVMPDIDAVAMATPKGGVPQSELFTVPRDWPPGQYVVWMEVNVEGDYNSTFNDVTYPTPKAPVGEWDSWAQDYGYPYRGQPSVAYRVPIEIDGPGSSQFATRTAAGRSSWDVWAADYGKLESLDGMSDDPTRSPGSGADRLSADGQGNRLVVLLEVLDELGTQPPPDKVDDGELTGQGEPNGDPEERQPVDESPAGEDPVEPTRQSPETIVEVDEESEGGAVILSGRDLESGAGVGEIRGLSLGLHPDELHAHEWIQLAFQAPDSSLGLHRYEVRVATAPIVDEATFVSNGRPAKGATDDPEGAASLMLPVDGDPGDLITADVGDLVASTHYYVAVRGVDILNRPGPISVAEIDTPRRVFTTVTPCFVASVVYGSPLSTEVAVLRRFRDRWLMSHAPGRAAVSAYYSLGPRAAAWVSKRARTRAALRTVLGLFVDALD